MRRSSIGLPLRPSYSPHDDGDDVPFNDDSLFDGGDDAEVLESPGRVSDQQQQTPRRPNRSNAVQDDDDEDVPRSRSKGKAKATYEDRDGGSIEDEIAQGLEDVDMREEDENNEVTPKKKPKEKRPRKKRASAEIPCNSSPFSETRLSS